MTFALESPIHRCAFDLPANEQRIQELEEKTNQPDFWEDYAQAQAVMRELSELRDQVKTWRDLETRARDLDELLSMATAESDEAMAEDIASEVTKLAAEVDQLEFELIFSGEYDRNNAILAIHAGAGGTESQDWAEMLLRMYLRWAEHHRFRGRILESTPGEEAGLKSVMVEIAGPYAYGYLKAERGVHRLVRISPFDASKARHTSFALVEVMPEVEDTSEISINLEDLRIDVFRASGAGGQHVQKSSTAVRITHIPTGIVASCQNERSQLQNKEIAMKILQSRLLELDLEKKAEEQARLKGEHVTAGWGNQIRSYVLHPYRMVKDHRTGYETGDTTAILDGEINDFIRVYLKSTLGEAS